jgi:hypothetical protein
VQFSGCERLAFSVVVIDNAFTGQNATQIPQPLHHVILIAGFCVLVSANIPSLFIEKVLLPNNDGEADI